MGSNSFETSYPFFFFFNGLARRGEKSSLFLQHSKIVSHSKGIVTGYYVYGGHPLRGFGGAGVPSALYLDRGGHVRQRGYSERHIVRAAFSAPQVDHPPDGG